MKRITAEEKREAREALQRAREAAQEADVVLSSSQSLRRAVRKSGSDKRLVEKLCELEKASGTLSSS